MTIGIITMHRVPNMGSVLQAYALQHTINQLGHRATIIDYVFPQKKLIPLHIRVLRWGLDLLKGRPNHKKRGKLNEFISSQLILTRKYNNTEELKADPPIFDIYCTGSDQVWNPMHIGNDMTFFLDFVPDSSPKISYASSFALDSIPKEYYSRFSRYLSRYTSITVREDSGINIIRTLINKNVLSVCDPTLLLKNEEWLSLADHKTHPVNGAYILVYIVGYMYNPRPAVYRIINEVKKEIGIPVYFFDGGIFDLVNGFTHLIKGVGPYDLINYIKNASFVITDSFHGSVFSTLFSIPMIALINDKNKDSRITDLRRNVNGDRSLIPYDKVFCFNHDYQSYYNCDPLLVERLRFDSISTLQRIIDDASAHLNSNSSRE